jgi:DNA-binding response OmpR family regulator
MMRLMPASPKIAIVDDERDLVHLTAKRLRAGGFDVASYLEGKGAYEFICREKPDLVLLDIWLPDVSGLEIFKQVRANQELTLPGLKPGESSVWHSLPIALANEYIS